VPAPIKVRRRVALSVEAGSGVLLLVRPDVAIDAAGARHDRLTRRVLQILGACQLVQALVIARLPEPAVVKIGAAVDALHCASMVLVGVARPADRRLDAL